MEKGHELIGCDSLRGWLTAQGFRVALDDLSHKDNECNWYAYRNSRSPARDCECNYGKPMQIVVHPWRIAAGNGVLRACGLESVEIDVTGEVEGRWYQLRCYGIKHDELMTRLHEIEEALIAAWNALRRPATKKG